MLFESLTSPVNALLTRKAAFTQTMALCLKKGSLVIRFSETILLQQRGGNGAEGDYKKLKIADPGSSLQSNIPKQHTPLTDLYVLFVCAALFYLFGLQ